MARAETPIAVCTLSRSALRPCSHLVHDCLGLALLAQRYGFHNVGSAAFRVRGCRSIAFFDYFFTESRCSDLQHR